MIVSDKTYNAVMILNTKDIIAPIRIEISAEKPFSRTNYGIEITVPNLLPITFGDYNTENDARDALRKFMKAIRDDEPEFIFDIQQQGDKL